MTDRRMEKEERIGEKARENTAQNLAIGTIDKNVSLSAGAGTGKTRVLTHRYIEILKRGHFPHGNPVQGIVAITFTNKATAEMNFRIRKLIGQEMEKQEYPWRDYLEKMDFSRISTIDSFCHDLIRQFPVEAGVDPGFEVLEPLESKVLLEDVLDELLEAYESRGLVNDLMMMLGHSRDYELKDAILDFYQSLWQAKGLRGEDLVQRHRRLLFEGEDLDRSLREELVDLEGHLSKRMKFAKRLQEDDVQAYLAGASLNKEEKLALYKDLEAFITDHESLEKVKSLLGQILILEDRARFDDFCLWVTVFEDLEGAYQERKKQLGFLDFNDLQVLTLKLLDRKDILREVQDRIQYLMVDEFQDTNGLQLEIFKKICSHKTSFDRQNFFMVGDPKQSIYGFRGADVSVFSEAKDLIRQSGGINITMDKSYRSSGKIVSFVNELFEKKFPGIDVALEAWGQGLGDEEVSFLEWHEEHGNKVLVEEMVKLHEEQGVAWKDMAVLFRTANQGREMEELMKAWDIPYVNHGSTQFFEREESRDILNLLKVIQQPLEDIAFYGLLRSPLVGLKDDSVSWYFAFLQGEVTEEELKAVLTLEERDLLVRGLEKLQASREDFSRLPLSMAFYRLTKRWKLEGLYQASSGVQGLNNIEKWQALAHDGDEKGLGLSAWLDELRLRRLAGEEEAAVVESGEGSVKLMTIHKAKGLEFPYLFLPQLHRGKGNHASPFSYDKDLGLGIKFADTQRCYDLISTREKESEAMEELRVLYVAMTRAEKKLYLGMVADRTPSNAPLAHLEDKVEMAEFITCQGLEGKKRDRKFSLPSKGRELEKFKPQTEIPKEAGAYSITAWQVYLRNPREYFLRYKWQLEAGEEVYPKATGFASKVDGVQLGLLLHEWVETYEEGEDTKRRLVDLIGQSGLDMEAYLPVAVAQSSHFLQLLEGYEILNREWPFHLELEGHRLMGIMDLIVKGPEGIEIWDIKTNRFYNEGRRAELVQLYTPQLILYALGFRALTGDLPSKIKLAFLHDGSFEDLPVDEEILAASVETWIKWMNFVSSHDDIRDYPPLPKKESIGK